MKVSTLGVEVGSGGARVRKKGKKTGKSAFFALFDKAQAGSAKFAAKGKQAAKTSPLAGLNRKQLGRLLDQLRTESRPMRHQVTKKGSLIPRQGVAAVHEKVAKAGIGLGTAKSNLEADSERLVSEALAYLKGESSDEDLGKGRKRKPLLGGAEEWSLIGQGVERTKTPSKTAGVSKKKTNKTGKESAVVAEAAKGETAVSLKTEDKKPRVRLLKKTAQETPQMVPQTKSAAPSKSAASMPTVPLNSAKIAEPAVSGKKADVIVGTAPKSASPKQGSPKTKTTKTMAAEPALGEGRRLGNGSSDGFSKPPVVLADKGSQVPRRPLARKEHAGEPSATAGVRPRVSREKGAQAEQNPRVQATRTKRPTGETQPTSFEKAAAAIRPPSQEVPVNGTEKGAPLAVKGNKPAQGEPLVKGPVRELKIPKEMEGRVEVTFSREKVAVHKPRPTAAAKKAQPLTPKTVSTPDATPEPAKVEPKTKPVAEKVEEPSQRVTQQTLPTSATKGERVRSAGSLTESLARVKSQETQSTQRLDQQVAGQEMRLSGPQTGEGLQAGVDQDQNQGFAFQRGAVPTRPGSDGGAGASRAGESSFAAVQAQAAERVGASADAAGGGESALPQPAFSMLEDGMEEAYLVKPKSVTVKLKPPELGEVKITVKREGDQLQAQIETQSSRTAKLIRDHQAELEQSLRERGMEFEQFDVREERDQQDPEERQRQSSQQQAAFNGESSEQKREAYQERRAAHAAGGEAVGEADASKTAEQGPVSVGGDGGNGPLDITA